MRAPAASEPLIPKSLAPVLLAQEPDFLLGELVIRPSICQVMTSAGQQALQPRVMQVLVALAQRRGNVVSRDELIVRCWNGAAVSDDAIQRCIAKLRRLCQAHPGFHLQTVARVGYVLTELVSAAVEEEPAGLWERLRAALLTPKSGAAALVLVAAGAVRQFL